jgi:ATP-dependent protease HslVU (ClpYQ) peptidase subunit
LTCIAVRDGIIAADSQATGDFVEFTQKLYAKNGAIVGFCGLVTQGLVFVDWYFNRQKRKPSLEHESDWSAIVLKKDGLEYWDNSLRPFPVSEKFYAIGSGCQFAMGAMKAGCSAQQAVEVACALDPYCNLPVITLSLQGTNKGQARKKARKKR